MMTLWSMYLRYIMADRVLQLHAGSMKRIEIEVDEVAGARPDPSPLHAGPWRVAVGAGDLLVLERAGGGYPGGGFALAGRIGREGSVMDVAACISTSRWTGTLTVAGSGATRSLRFVRGALRMAGSTFGSDRLGEVMRRQGRITQTELEDALTEVGPEMRLGRVLVAKGAATSGEVFEMLKHQVEEIFHAAMAVREGSFAFDSALDPESLPASMSLDTRGLLLEAARRIDELSELRRLIPGTNMVLQRKPRSFPPRTEGVSEEFLARCDGRRTLEEIAGDLGLVEYEAVKLAYRYLVDGVLEVVPTEATSGESIRFVVDRYNEMVDLVASAVSAAGDPGDFFDEVRSFPSSAGASEETTRRLVLDAAGHLDHANVAAILREVRVHDRMGHLVRTLTQYLFFVLFCADGRLPRAVHRKVGDLVHSMLQKIGS